MQSERMLEEFVSRLQGDLGDRLVSVVLYGPEAHGDVYREVGDLNVMIVLADLEPATLGRCGEAVQWWLGKGQPWPRLFSRALIADSLDVFPIEFLDIGRHHRVLAGRDPLAELQVPREQLRLQCERELREKLMRLREGYVEARGRGRALRKLLAASYPSFVGVFRGCLDLMGSEVPVHGRDVATALCQRLELEGAPFDEVASVAEGSRGGDLEDLFSRYYRELSRVVERIDRHVETPAAAEQGDTP